MKYLIFCFILLATACNSPKNNTALEGIYTASYEHEFGRSVDTLILKKANNGTGVYQITRHTGLIKKLRWERISKRSPY